MRTEIVNKEQFDLFLSRLDSDREEAARKYLLLRIRLTRYFQRRAMESCPEELSDEVIARIILHLWEGKKIGDISKYSFGVAKFVMQEEKRRRAKCVSFDSEYLKLQAPSMSEYEMEERDWLAIAMRLAFGTLSEEEIEFLTKYYAEDKPLGSKPAAARKRAQRLRARLYNELKKWV